MRSHPGRTQPRAGILRIFFYKTESVSSPETLSVLLFFIFSCGVSGNRTTPEGASFDTGYRASIRVDQVARDIKDQAETESGERLPGESVIGRLVDLVEERLACRSTTRLIGGAIPRLYGNRFIRPLASAIL